MLSILELSPKITTAKHSLVLASGGGYGFLQQRHSNVSITDGSFQ